jgi:hypothetical protein
MEEKFPSKDYDKKRYTFTKNELTQLRQMESIMALGTLARVFIEKLVNNVVIPRIKIDPKKVANTDYNSDEGVFDIYLIKNFCTLCKEKKAEYDHNKKGYCGTCLTLIQAKEEAENKNDVRHQAPNTSPDDNGN